MVLAVQGVSSLGISEGHKFPFLTDSPLSDTFAALESKILDRYPYAENQTLVDINLEDDVKAVSIYGFLGKKKIVSNVRKNYTTSYQES